MDLPPTIADRWHGSLLRIHNGGLVDWSRHRDRPYHPHRSGDFWVVNLLADGTCEATHAGGSFVAEGPLCYLVPPRTTWREREARGPLRHARTYFGVHPVTADAHPLAAIGEVVVLGRPPDGLGERFLETCASIGWRRSAANRALLRPAVDEVMLAMLSRAQADGSVDLAADRSDSVLIRSVIEDARTKLMQPEFDADRMASMAGLSRSRYNVVFKAATGQAPAAWLRRKRLDLAANLMREGDVASIAEVAQRSGFSTQALFARLFKREYGESPLRWWRGKR